MRKSRVRESGLVGRVGAAVGLSMLAGVGAAAASELRHRRAVSADPLWDLLRAPLAGSSLTVLSADGAELHVEVFGPVAAPTFVLVPGWTEELQVWDLLTRGLLGRGFRVVSYDLRGQGLSASGRGLDQRIERYGEDLAAVLAACCGGRDDVIVAGHSMGGMAVVAWAATVDASSFARAVALISTGVSGLVDGLGLLPASVPLEARRAILTPLLAGDQPMVRLSTPLSRSLLRHGLFGPDATAAQLAFLEPMIWRMHGRARAAAALTLRELDLSAALARVDVPALVVVGDGDRLTPPAQARRLVAALPQVAEYVLLERTGHMTPLERPHELCEALVGLAESVGIAAPVADAAAEAAGAAGRLSRPA